MTVDMTRPAPSTRARVLFCVLLGAFSTLCAEVTIGASPFVFFDVWGLAVVLPLYTLHILVLAPLVLRQPGGASFPALYLAGVLFGLYEAYITKVLWNPPWDIAAFRIGDVAVITTLMIACFWHPFMAFITPLFLAERLLTGSTRVLACVPGAWRARLQRPGIVVAIAALGGTVHGALQQSVPAALGSVVLNGLIVLGLLWLWRRAAGGARWDWPDLLPGPRAWRVLAAALLAFYGLWSALIRPEAWPGPIGHLAVWVMYAAVVLLLRRAIRRLPAQAAAVEPAPAPVSLRSVLRFGAVYLCYSLVAATLLAPGKDYVFLVLWIAGVLAGAMAVFRTVRTLVWDRPRGALPGAEVPTP